MEIKDILSPDCAHCAVEGSSKKRILETISLIASEHQPDIEQATVLASLMNREKMGSTGIGNGIALPHGRLQGLKDVTAILVTTKTGVDFDAMDNRPVDIFFAILVPEDQADGHLQTLATIAGKLNDKETVQAIRDANNDDALIKAIL
ncbi:PTS IIA-like nitrogen regulatory protein PtsN [Aestuariibacter salexigens]|uniref:PTS IIA-like nitrogen regulatory protein PtsN n=1 Tax=Aestuariibacter salexigens TaxID=226010 RepID=UPI0004143C32|nr:PTS IIA-like nitrogen regulatory protein PtsN [Aestuariibacter salexigens]